MSIISTTQPRLRLPDQVTIEFGPPDLLGRAFLSLDRTVRDRGIYLSISHDLDQLAEANLNNRKDWYPLPPMFDPAYGGITPDNTFWICGVDRLGDVVLAHACRLYSWSGTTLADEYESMRFFYPDPQEREEHRAAGESCIVETDAARRLTGRVCYSGAMWVRPDYRGRNLAHITPRLTRAYALTTWYPDFVMGMVNTSSATGGKAAQTYGWRNMDTGVRLRGAQKFGDELVFAFGWLERQELIDDLEEYTSLLNDPAGELVV